MKKFFVIILLALMTVEGYSWNRLGHDASAMIAEKYVTKKAKKNMAKYLDGHQISWYASYMDYMGYICKLGLSNEWFDHCVPVNKDFQYANGDYDNSGISQKGDAIMCVQKAIEEMKDGGYKNLPDSTVNLYLAWLVHFVPDSHCPSHIIYNYRPSNYWVDVNGTKKLFHGIWDGVPDVHGIHHWSASEYCEQLTAGLTKQQKKEIEMNGDVLAWVNDNANNCIVAYDIVRQDKLTDVDCCKATVLADQQLLKGGIRLAYVLNMIFG